MTLSIALVALFTHPAQASQTITGDYIRIKYSDAGAWGHTGNAFQLYYSDTWIDANWAGTPWNQQTFQYEAVGPSGATSSFEFGVNTDSSFVSTTAPVILSEMDLSSGTTNQSMYVYEMTALQISKTETWEDGDQWLTVKYAITNTSSTDVSNFVVMHGLDADQDYDLFADFNTLNDTRGDGLVATSTGPTSGVAIAYGVCDALDQQVGHGSWSESATAAFRDDDGASADDTMHWRASIPTLAPGETREVAFMVTWGESIASANTIYDTNIGPGCFGTPAPEPPMTLEAPLPGLGGETNTFALEGAEPGDDLYLVYGRSAGSTLVPTCTASFLGVSGIRLLDVQTADSMGNATFTVDIPAVAEGRTARFQVATPTSCTVSNVLRHSFP